MTILYIPHGGGPLPLLNDENHHELIRFLTAIPTQIPKPTAIIVITAHWEASSVGISHHPSPGMLFDYYGFPPETYHYSYPAKGDPALANSIHDTLVQRGIPCHQDNERGFDHGTFVPLMMMYPDAEIPVIQMSLQQDLNPALHIQLGEALAEYSAQGMLLLGSGSSFHNLRIPPELADQAPAMSQGFDDWLNQTLLGDQPWDAKATALCQWAGAPHAAFAHPREEHLLPLHVCFGAAKARDLTVSNVFDKPFYGVHVSAFLWR